MTIHSRPRARTYVLGGNTGPCKSDKTALMNIRVSGKKAGEATDSIGLLGGVGGPHDHFQTTIQQGAGIHAIGDQGNTLGQRAMTGTPAIGVPASLGNGRPTDAALNSVEAPVDAEASSTGGTSVGSPGVVDSGGNLGHPVRVKVEFVRLQGAAARHALRGPAGRLPGGPAGCNTTGRSGSNPPHTACLAHRAGHPALARVYPRRTSKCSILSAA